MRAGYASGCTDESNLLSPLYGVTNGDERFAEMEIASDDSGSMVDVNDIAGQEKIVDQCNDTAVRGIHRLPRSAPEVDSKVAARHMTVEEASRSKFTRDHRCPWATERRRPHRRRIVRTRAHRSRPQVFACHAGGGGRIEWAGEGAVDCECRRDRWRELGKRQARSNRLDLARRSAQDDTGHEAAFRIDGNSAERVPCSGGRCDEMERLACQRAANRNDRIGRRCSRAQRQANDCARLRARRRDREPRGLRADGSGQESAECNRCIDASVH